MGKFIDFAPRKVNQNNNPPSASKSEKPRNANGAYLVVIIVLTIVFICSLNSLFSTTPTTSDSFKPAISSPSVNGDSTNSEDDISSSPESPTQDNNNFTNSAEHAQTETNSTKRNFSIEILNGSGISNTASDVKTYLEQKEYKIANIGTANNLYPSTVIYFKKGNDNLANELAKDLNQYETSVLENSELVGEYDILIVVGQK